jgi:hypothetical protein
MTQALRERYERPERKTPLLRVITTEQPPRRLGLVERAIRALRQECALCEHSRLWHHAHMIAWGRD